MSIVHELWLQQQQAMKDIQSGEFKRQWEKSTMESKMTDQLLRYAEFAGITVYENSVAIVKNGIDNIQYPYLHLHEAGRMWFNRSDSEVIEWTDQTYLGKLVIVDAIMRSEKWPHYLIIKKSEPFNDKSWFAIYDTRYSQRISEEYELHCDAVLAAVEEVGK